VVFCSAHFAAPFRWLFCLKYDSVLIRRASAIFAVLAFSFSLYCGAHQTKSRPPRRSRSRSTASKCSSCRRPSPCLLALPIKLDATLCSPAHSVSHILHFQQVTPCWRSYGQIISGTPWTRDPDNNRLDRPSVIRRLLLADRVGEALSGGCSCAGARVVAKKTAPS
jgi:hypothetical protein